MEFEKNTMLFGADSTPRIVAIELVETGTTSDGRPLYALRRRSS